MKAITAAVIFTIAALIGTGAHAATIDSVTGSVAHGSEIVITGAGFGSADVSKITWDDFEDGRVDLTATVGSWGSVNLLKSYGISRHKNSAYASYYDFVGYGTAGVQAVNTVLSQKWFAQYWVKLDSFDWGTGTYGSTSQHLSNVKFFRLWNPGSEKENFYTQFWWGVNDNSYSNVEYITQPVTTKNFTTPMTKSQLSDGTWHLLQFEFIDSSAPGTADAVLRFWQDGQLKEVRTGFIARTNQNLKRPYFIGFFNAWGPNTAAGETSRAPNLFIMDDVYASPTLARVEIGDNQSYNSCTHREVQLPLSWSDGQIKVKVNQGSFPTDPTPAYLFVVDDNGNVSDGKKVNFGGVPPQNLKLLNVQP